MDYNYYHHVPLSPPITSYGRERYNNMVNGSSSGGTVVPPNVGEHSPPSTAPIPRPHTTQPHPGYGYAPPPPMPQGFPKAPHYGPYPGYYPPYAGYPPPVSYAESLPPPPPPPRPSQPAPADQSKPAKQLMQDESTGDKKFEDDSPKSSAQGTPTSMTEADAAGMGNPASPVKEWPPNERDKLLTGFLERVAYTTPINPLPPHPYPPYYSPYYPLPHGYHPHIPPPQYNYPPPNGTESPERHEEGEWQEEREGGGQPGRSGEPIMPGGFASSPAAETPPSPAKLSRPPTPPRPAGTPASVPAPKKVDLEVRTGSMPPPKTRLNLQSPVPEEQLKPKSDGSRKGKKDKEIESQRPTSLGPGGREMQDINGHVWGMYLFDHSNQSKGSPPTPKPELRSLLRRIAQWIIQDIEPKNSMVIAPGKLMKFYQSSKVESEPLNWQGFISSIPPPNLSELYQQLECHHFLTPPLRAGEGDPGLSTYTSYEPTIPALTPAGFEQWMMIQMSAYPDREARRLQKILAEFPIHDKDKNERLPKSITRECLPTVGDDSVGERWDEAVMNVRRGGYISNGMDDGPEFGSPGSSQDREDRFSNPTPTPVLLRKKTDMKYASTTVVFDDLRKDQNKTTEIERKRKPYAQTKGVRDVIHPPSSGGGGGTPTTGQSAASRPGGMGERQGSYDTSASGGSGSGGYVSTPYSPTPSNSNTYISTASSRHGGGGVELNSGNSIAGSTTTTAKAEYGGGVKAGAGRLPEQNNHANMYHRLSASAGPTTPGSAHPSNVPSGFSSPQARNAGAAAAGGGPFTPISPLATTGMFPDAHHYPTPYHTRGNRMSAIIPDIPSPERERTRRRAASISAQDAAAEYFGGPLSGGGAQYIRDYEPERDYRSGGGGGGGHHHGHEHQAYPPVSPAGYYRRGERGGERDRRPDWEADEEAYYHGGGDRERERERRDAGYRGRKGDTEQEEEVIPRRRGGRSRPPAEFRDHPTGWSG